MRTRCQRALSAEKPTRKCTAKSAAYPAMMNAPRMSQLRHGGGRAIGGARVARGHLIGQRALLAPHEDSTFGTPRSDRVERRLVRSLVEELRARVLFGTPHRQWLASDHCRYPRTRIVQVAD